MDENVKGLINLRNMCFINVIAQSLSNLISVKQFFFSSKCHSHVIESEENLSEIIKFLEHKGDSSISSSERKKLEARIKNFKESNQPESLINESPSKKVNYECLFCLLQNFFFSYSFSDEKTLDLLEIRGSLMTLNEHIQKFNASGVLRA